MNILISSASRKVGLVRAFQSALARLGGGSVIAVDTSPFSPALYAADRHFLVPASTEPGFVEELLRICRMEQIRVIVPSRDEELPVFAEARERFETRGVRVIVPSSQTLSICQDKLAFVRFCREHGFGIPHTYDIDQRYNARFPLFVKPRFGKGGKGAQRVLNNAELNALNGESSDWVVQEYIDCPEYTIDLFSDFDSRVVSVVPRLRILVVGGESYVSRTSKKEEHLISEAARLALELRLVGHNTIQCFWDGVQMKFIEVNPRFGGGAALGFAAGADTPVMLLRLVAGDALPSRIGEYEADLVMLRFTEDFFFSAGALTVPAKEDAPTQLAVPDKSTHSNLQAILFDLDNTLYPEQEFVASGYRAVASCLARHHHLDPDSLWKRMMEILRTRGRKNVLDTLLQEINLDPLVWLRPLVLVYRSHPPTISLFQESLSLLSSLRSRGLKLGLVTDGPAFTQRRKIAALDLERRVDVIVCTDELGAACTKPSMVPFEVASTLLGVKPVNAAYIADDISKDFAGPNHLGMRSVRIRRPGLVGVQHMRVPVEAVFQPQFEIDSLNDVLQALQLE